MRYRAEIDGLRALAVAPVILFHAGFNLFNGGFVGVDIFFVISGYLITTILIEDFENKRFSIVNFYERRARRILPALFFVIFVCIPFAWTWMLPSEFKDFSKSLIAVSVFASNIFFWRDQDYFAGATDETLLLHTWSLAVEEQYYLLFPIFLFLTWRFGKNKVFWAIVFMAVMSFLLSEWASRVKPMASFYLSPTRAWELFAGSITAFIGHKRGVQKSNVFSILGLTAILFAIFLYDEKTPFPSFYTLIPVFGAVLIVLFGAKETLVGSLLSTKAFVGVGLISYSAYLWHQPLFAFARLKNLSEVSANIFFLLTVLTFVLAYLSWRYVEIPFRDKHGFTRKFIFFSAILLSLAFFSFGLLGYSKNGNLWRYPETVQTYFNEQEFFNKYVWDLKKSLRGKNFDPKKRKILVIGDSNSGDLINVLSLLGSESDVSFSTLTVDSGCGNLYLPRASFVDRIEVRRVESCSTSDDLLSDKNKKLMSQADWVFFASSWQEWEVQLISSSYINLHDEFGDKFWFFGNKHLDFNPSNFIRTSGGVSFPSSVRPKFDSVVINNELSKIVGRRFIDPYQLFCDDGFCLTVNEQAELLLYDGFHLSEQGASFFALKLKTFFDNL